MRKGDDNGLVDITAQAAKLRFLVKAESANFEAVEHDARGFCHSVPHSFDVLVEPIERRADQHRIMDQRADFDALFGGEAGGQAQHFGAVGLAGEIPQ